MSLKIIRFDIEVNLISDVSAAIKPIRREDGSTDSTALAEYQEFLINVLSVIDENDFEVIEDTESPFSATSYYITTYKKSESTMDSIKCIIFIRISDHNLSEETHKQRVNYYKSKADILKQPKSKKKQTWRFKNIVVNNETFDSYEDALDEIDNKLKSMQS